MKAKSTNRKERACNFIRRQTKSIGMFMITVLLTTAVATAQKSTVVSNDTNSDEVQTAVLKNPGTVQPVKNISVLTPVVPLCPAITSLNMIDHTHQIAILGWDNLANFDSIKVRYALTGTTNYRTVAISGTPNPGSIIIDGLAAVTSYDFEVSTICHTGAVSNWSPVLTLTTFPEPAPRYSNQRNTSFLKLNPNPATSYTTLSFAAPINSLNSVMIATSTGKVIYKRNVLCPDGKIMVPINLTNIPPGLYFVSVGNNNGFSVERLIVQ